MTIRDVLWAIPCIQVALLWRCYVQRPGGSDGATLGERELAERTIKNGERI